MRMSHTLKLFQFLDVVLCVFSSFLYLCFTLGSPRWPFFKVTTTDDPNRDIFHSYWTSMNAGILLLFSFTVSIYLPTLSIYCCTLSMLPIRNQFIVEHIYHYGLSSLSDYSTASVSYQDWMYIASTICPSWNSDDTNVSSLALVPQLPPLCPCLFACPFFFSQGVYSVDLYSNSLLSSSVIYILQWMPASKFLFFTLYFLIFNFHFVLFISYL